MNRSALPLLGDYYHERLFEISGRENIVAYWPGREAEGSVANDISGTGKHGAHTAVTLGQPGIGDGSPSLGYNGTTSFTNAYSTELAGVEGIVNPGLETAGAGGADIWGTWAETAGDGALANEATLTHAGTSAVKATAGATANTKVAQTVTVKAGRQYSLTFWTRGDGTNAGRYGVYDASNSADIVGATTTGVAGTSYTQVTQVFTTPTGCVSVRIDLWCPATDTGIAYFDDVSLKGNRPFNSEEGFVTGWAKVASASVWTDGVVRSLVTLRAGAANYYTLYKNSVNNRVDLEAQRGGTAESIAKTSFSPVNFFQYGMSWSASNGRMRLWVNGTLINTATGLGTWAGELSSTSAVIGAVNTSASQPWSGFQGHVLLGNVEPTAAQMLEAYLAGVMN